jgi:acyl-coenzyme A synthetase/AMP-(fatty) acid ligase
VTPLSHLLTTAGPEGDLVAFGREGARTRADLRRDVATLAARLAPCAGARVAMHCHDAYAFAVGLLALGQVGALAVLPPGRQPGTLLRLAGDVAAFLLDGADAPDALASRPCWSPLAGPGPRAELVSLEREAAWVELFTSGTTGEEKPIAKLVRHLEDEVQMLGSHFASALADGARMLSTASPQHLYGLLFRVLWPLAAGRPFLRTALLHPGELVPYLEEPGSFALASTPVALRGLAERAELAACASRCRAVFSSGGPLEAEVARRVADTLGAPPIEVYGSTETGGVATRQQWQGDESWQPLPGVEAVVADDGRLVVTSAFVSSGEPVGPGATRIATGDRAEADGSGGFRLRGRTDRTVKIAEKRLSLPDMESRLREHPAVAEAALVRVDGPGEPRVAAVVVPTAAGRALYASGGRRALGRELAEHLARDFDRVLLPRTWRVADALPRDAQGKTSVRALRALLGEAPRRPELLAAQHQPGRSVVEWRVPADLAQLEGHFPGQPVVAGVVQVHWVMGVLEERLGAAPNPESLEALKFHHVLGPGDHVRLSLEIEDGGARFRFELVDAADPKRIYSSGRGRCKR